MEISECYQPLFDLMYNEHGLVLIIEEMDEIIKAADKVKELYDKLMSEQGNEKP